MRFVIGIRLTLLLGLSACGSESFSTRVVSPAERDAHDRGCSMRDASACVAAGDARTTSREHDELLRAYSYYERACELNKGKCSRLTEYTDELARRCTQQRDALSCGVAATLLGYAPPARRDVARITWLAEQACELGPGMCNSFKPEDSGRYLTALEVDCLDSRLIGGGCVTLHDRLAKFAGIQRGPDDWLPLLAEAARGNYDPQGTCAIDPSACLPAHPWPAIPPPAQANAQRKQVIDDHTARCRAGDLTHCDALVRIDALHLAEVTLSLSDMFALERRVQPDGAEWARLCGAGLRTSCLSRGILMHDELALQRACDLGEPIGCTRAAGAAISRNDFGAAQNWLGRACRLGRNWACAR